MTEIILGRDFISNKDNIDLVPEFFSLIDPDGTNVIQERYRTDKGDYYCICLFKFIGSSEPFEAPVELTPSVFKKIVLNIDIAKLGEIH
jgi:hypothetical protein